MIDPVADYADLMESCSISPHPRAAQRGDFRIRFDAMHAVTGPYAKEILEQRLGAPAGTVINGVPLEDFGGGHPDPNLTYAHELVEMMYGDPTPDFGAASDGDGDRNMILGKQFLRHALRQPGRDRRQRGAGAGLRQGPGRRGPFHADQRGRRPGGREARPSLLRNADRLEIFRQPDGCGQGITLCGEESFGTGSDHVREKDGLWAVLFWLNILAVRAVGGRHRARSTGRSIGRNVYSRHDYEGLPTEAAEGLMEHLQRTFARPAGQAVRTATRSNSATISAIPTRSTAA